MLAGLGAACIAGLLWALGLTGPLGHADPNRADPEPVQARHRGFLGQPSLERYRIAFDDVDVRLHIPRNYLFGWTPTERTQGSPGFIGMTTFPDFAGATRDNWRCFAGLDLMRCDVVQFAYRHPVRPIEPNRTWYLRDREFLVPREYGLIGRPGDDLFVYFGDDGWVVRVGCSEDPKRQLGACEMFFPAVGADWRIIFRPGLFPRWRELAEGLRSLIESFAVTTPGEGRP
jgi:hypothetical protein